MVNLNYEKYIKELDMFGYRIVINASEGSPTFKTRCGGIVSICV